MTKHVQGLKQHQMKYTYIYTSTAIFPDEWREILTKEVCIYKQKNLLVNSTCIYLYYSFISFVTTYT